MAIELQNYSLLNDANLVAYYRFNNGALTTDSKGSNTLTDHGTVAANASGKFGYGADFGSPNSTKYFTLATTFGITNASQWTFNLWIRKTAEPGGTEDIIDLRPSSNDCYFDLQYNPGLLGCDAKATGGSYAVSLADSTWHMITFIRDASHALVYLDSILRVTVTPGVNVATGGFGLGNLTGGGNAYSGLMDDVSVFTRALSQTEITNYYNAVVAGGFLFNFF